MTRPYSLAEYPMMALMSKALESASALSFGVADCLKLLALLASWAGLCWTLEAHHKHMNRPKISSKVANEAFSIGVGIAAAFNSATLIFNGIHYISSLLYAKKETKEKKEGTIAELSRDFLNTYSFLVRGLAQASIFLTSQLMYSAQLSPKHFLIALAIGTMTAARNLIGDLRDMKYDAETFCVKYGVKHSKFVTGALKAVAAVAISFAVGTPLAALPIIVGSIAQSIDKNYQNMHRLAVFESLAVLGNILFASIGSVPGMIAMNLAYLSVMLNLKTYEAVPRPSNKSEK
jgi:hypothetical protein